MAVQGERIAGGFILITGIDGTRYAVQQQAITVIYDADEVPGRNDDPATWWACRARTLLAR
jgi:hypothetical protein